ncbi:MAG: hypothetical protein D6820_15685, partial [Lentisphaerae bacterium]
MPSVPQLTLIDPIDITPFGGNLLRVCDVNGDGESEYVILQSPGQFQSQVRDWKNSGVTPRDQDVFCITVIDSSGNVLWQYGSPWPEPMNPYVSHGSGDQLVIDDVDGDGELEIVTVRKDELLILAASCGRIKNSTRLPADNFTRLATARLRGKRDGC